MAKKTEDIVEDAPKTSHLIKLFKDGETVEAHPTQVALWESQGWIVQE